MLAEKPILVVDDDIVDAMTVQRAFKKLKIKNTVYHFGKGEEALDFLHEQKAELPKLILLDLNMQGMHGIEFLEHIKNNIDFKHIPVIILTTSDEKKDRMQTYRRGAAGYLVKPVRFETFVKMLKTVINYWSLSKQYS